MHTHNSKEVIITMNRLQRLIIASVIVLSGLALIPYVALSNEEFRWQRFAGVYDGEAEVSCNYANGKAGSFFTCVVLNFPANATVTISVQTWQGRWHVIGTGTTSDTGTFNFIIQTDDDLIDGAYGIKAETNPSVETTLTILSSAPLREKEGSSPVLIIPASAGGGETFLPLIRR